MNFAKINISKKSNYIARSLALIVGLLISQSVLASSENMHQKVESTYVLGTGELAADRLILSEQVYGRATKELFEELKLGQGMNVLVMACGTGAQLPWLSHVVGGKGQITCADISEDQLTAAKKFAKKNNLKNVIFQRADIQNFHTEQKFDLVMARFVLVHIENPLSAIRSMKALVKPGGLLLSEEHDISFIQAYPKQDAVLQALDILAKASKDRRVDFSYGRKLLEAFVQAGVKSPKIRLDVPTYNRGIEKTLFEKSIREAKNTYLRSGYCDEVQIQRILKGLSKVNKDESVWLSLGGFFQVYAIIE